MKKKRILAMLLAVASCLSLAVSASAASTARKATDFRDFDKSAWYADAVSAAVDNGLLYGKSATVIDPNGDMTRAEMAAIINRSFGCYKAADISQYKDVAKSKWYYHTLPLVNRSAMIRCRLPLPSSGTPFFSCFHLVTAFRKNISSKPFGIWAKKEREHPAAQLLLRRGHSRNLWALRPKKEIRQKPVLRTWQFYRKS